MNRFEALKWLVRGFFLCRNGANIKDLVGVLDCGPGDLYDLARALHHELSSSDLDEFYDYLSTK